jgi:hypothetical protein
MEAKFSASASTTTFSHIPTDFALPRHDYATEPASEVTEASSLVI